MAIADSSDPIPSSSTSLDSTCEPHAADSASVERARAHLLSPAAADGVAETFKLLGDPTRVRLLDVLGDGERCVCDLAAIVGISESAVSHQLRVLRVARLVRVRRTGRQAFYALDDHHVMSVLHDVRRHVEEGLRR